MAWEVYEGRGNHKVPAASFRANQMLMVNAAALRKFGALDCKRVRLLYDAENEWVGIEPCPADAMNSLAFSRHNRSRGCSSQGFLTRFGIKPPVGAHLPVYWAKRRKILVVSLSVVGTG